MPQSSKECYNNKYVVKTFGINIEEGSHEYRSMYQTVPDTAEVKINPETNTLIRDGVENIMNPFDRRHWKLP